MSNRAAPFRVVAAAVAAILALLCALSAQEPARRLISTTPSVTETLCLLGLEEELVAVSDYCNYPESVKTLPRIGGLYNPNIEKIVSLRPTHVVLLKEHQELAQRLAVFHIPTVTVDHTSVDGVVDSIRILGRAFDRQSLGEEQSALLRRRLDQIARAAEPLEKPSVLIAIDRPKGELSEFYAAGRSPYFQELLEIAGGRNVLESSPAAFPTVTIEILLRLRPDIIIDLSFASRAAGSIDDWKKLAAFLPAVAEEKVYVITDDYATIPGPRIVQTAERFFRLLHPDAAKAEFAFRNVDFSATITQGMEE
ncbi:MAG: ABC transporter substrate-binding protein [Thermoguttaceae bacterium]|nr:ABC transporter substrate-binding protein [Thermoguttaceae bacterium]